MKGANPSRAVLAAAVVAASACSASQTQTDAAASKDVAAETAADAAADAAADTGGDSGTCAPTQTRCGAECVDPQTSFLHCGRCMNRCQGTQRCVAGACVRAGICPMSCRVNTDCRLCTYEGDQANWCCDFRNSQGSGRCNLTLGPRCPVNP